MSNSRIKLSVLITFYNQERYVDEALAGVLTQKTGFDFEVLIGDDGSSDGTVARIEAWRQKFPEKVKLFIRARVKGANHDPIARASANRIGLIKEARGDFLTFLDGDDFYTDTGKFQTQIDILEDPANSDCVACAHAVKSYWDDGRTRPINNPAMKEQKFEPERYWAVMYFPSHGLMFRNIFQKGFPEEIFAGNYFDDNSITCYFIKFGSIYYLPAIMAAYRQTGAGLFSSLDQAGALALQLIYFDLELKLHPTFKGAVAWRHRREFRLLNRCFSELDGPGFSEFRKIAARGKGGEELNRWLSFRVRGWAGQAARWRRYLGLAWSAFVFSIFKRDYFRPGGLK